MRKLARARNSAAPIVHGDKLYWMTAFWIARMPAAGTKPIGVVKASADAFIVDGDHLVWEDGGAIYTGPTSGDSRTELWRSPDVDGVSAFAADATHIYAAMSMSGTILAIPKSGGEAVVLVKTVQPRALVVDETKVYWLSQGSAEVPGGGVFSMAKSGGKPTPLLRWPGIDESSTMVTDGKSLYLVRGHEVVRVAKSGGVRRIAKLSHKCGAGYLYLDQYLDATNVYWISCDSDMHTIVQKVKR